MQIVDNFVSQKHFFGGTNESNVKKACYTKTNKPLIKPICCIGKAHTHAAQARVY